MANDLTLDAGSGGSTLATDEDASNRHYQLVKLADGTADSTTVIASGNGVHGGAIRTTLASDSTGQVKLAAGSAVVGEFSVGSATTATGDLAAAEDVALVSGKVGVMAYGVRDDSTPAATSGTDGDIEPYHVDANGRMYVNAEGGIAHDASGTGIAPVLGGAIAYATDGTAPGTAVAEADLSRLKCDLDGRLLTNDGHPFAWTGSANTAGAETAELQAAPGASLSLYLTDVVISSDAVQVVRIVEETGVDTELVPEIYLLASTSIVLHFRTPIRVTANKNIGYITDNAENTTILINGYTAA